MSTYKTETEAEHRERMKELQLEMRAKMKAAKERRGLLICHTGDGKGKTSAAFGMLPRGLGAGAQAFRRPLGGLRVARRAQRGVAAGVPAA